MSHILVLISNPANPALEQSLIDLIAHEIPMSGPARWLAPDIACELPIKADQGNLDQIYNEVQRAVGSRQIDVAIVPERGRRKQLLIADMDSTMIEQECIDEIAATLGLRDEISAITERAMNGEIPFDEALRQRVSHLRGVSRQEIDEIIANRLTYTPGAKQLVTTMAANGAWCALVSGGFTPFTQAIAKQLGFHENRANRLEFKDDALTGKVLEPILGATAKKQALLEMVEGRGGLEAALAVGDGANDLAMIREAGLGVAFHAKPLVAKEAQVSIIHGDLTALLYLQGFELGEFAS